MNWLRIVENEAEEEDGAAVHKTMRVIRYLIAGIFLFCAGLVAGNVFVCSLYYFFAR